MPEKFELTLGYIDIEVCFDNRHHDTVRFDVFNWTDADYSHSVILLSPQHAVQMALALLHHAETINAAANANQS